jgi:molybdopterin-biosynthesis enzyme MoeA-like protein
MVRGAVDRRQGAGRAANCFPITMSISQYTFLTSSIALALSPGTPSTIQKVFAHFVERKQHMSFHGSRKVSEKTLEWMGFLWLESGIAITMAQSCEVESPIVREDSLAQNPRLERHWTNQPVAEVSQKLKTCAEATPTSRGW